MDASLQRALAAHALAPEDLAALNDICLALIELKRDGELLPWAEKALTLDPRNIEFVCLRAHCLTLLGRHFEAIATWLHYASLPWNTTFYQLNLGHSLEMAGDFERGIPMLRRAWQGAAADNAPLAPVAERLLGEALLKTGLPQGFNHWLARNQDNSGSYRPDGVPSWTGEQDLRGKRLLVTNQLGFGDQFLLFSCLSHWLAAGAIIMVSCDSQIHALMKAALPQCTVVSAERPLDRGAPLPEALRDAVRAFAPDLHITLLHLPVLAAARTTPPTPYFTPYIQAPLTERNIAAEWVQDLRAKHSGKRLVGLFWDCSQRHFIEASSIDRYWAAARSLPLAAVNRLVSDAQVEPNIHFVSLHHPAAQPLAGIPSGNLGQYDPGIEDFADTAACIEQLDAVIAVDSGVANLSAMIGKPTAVLTPVSCDWRWGSQGSITPWMDNVSVLRQTLTGDWDTVVDDAIRWLNG